MIVFNCVSLYNLGFTFESIKNKKLCEVVKFEFFINCKSVSMEGMSNDDMFVWNVFDWMNYVLCIVMPTNFCFFNGTNDTKKGPNPRRNV